MQTTWITNPDRCDQENGVPCFSNSKSWTRNLLWEEKDTAFSLLALCHRSFILYTKRTGISSSTHFPLGRSSPLVQQTEHLTLISPNSANDPVFIQWRHHVPNRLFNPSYLSKQSHVPNRLLGQAKNACGDPMFPTGSLTPPITANYPMFPTGSWSKPRMPVETPCSQQTL